MRLLQFTVLLFIACPQFASSQQLELTNVFVDRCPDEIFYLKDGEFCIGIEDWDEHAIGVHREGCIQRVIYPSGRGNYIAVGKWTYKYSASSYQYDRFGYSKIEGYMQDEAEVGLWFYHGDDGLIKTEYKAPEEGVEIYNCILKN